MRSVEARLGKLRAVRTMTDKLSELKDRIAKVQTIQRSANEMRESDLCELNKL
jgi:ABC-type phosphate transport system auxiliary subunit